MNSLTLILCVGLVAVVYASRCPHGDVTLCMGIDCSGNNQTVGCEHDICTCMDPPTPDQSCLGVGDCMMVMCDKHDETPHCLDNACQCIKVHH